MKKNILITGGSSGIGEALAKHFYNKGWNVLITGRNVEKLENIANLLPGLHTIAYDSLKLDQEKEIVTFIAKNWQGKLDVLVNNAGHVELTPVHEMNRESLEAMYQTHLIAPSLLTAGCVEFLKATKGQIVNVSSSHGIKAYPQISAYGSAKAGLNMLTKIWALELAPFGIRVNALAPGPTDTPVLTNAGIPDEMILAIHESERTAIPLQRRGHVEDMVANASLLIDSGSDWLTGVILPVDGGISIS